MKTISKFAFAAVFLSSASLFTPMASAAPFSFAPIATQGDAGVVPAAMTRRERERMMHRRSMERHHMRSHRSMRRAPMRSQRMMPRKDMSSSDAGAMTNSRAPMSQRGPISPPKDMSTSDAGARNNTRAPASVPGPMTRTKDMSTTDSPK